VSSWFRRDKRSERVVVPLSSTTRPIHVVYFAQGSELPTAEGLAQAAAAWSDANLLPPLRDAAGAYRSKGLLSIELVKTDRLPPAPLPLLQYTGMGELDERILRSATDAIVVGGPDLNAQPYVGLWSSLAAALGIRALLQGTLFDPQALRIIDRDKALKWFAADGRVAAANHIQVPFSIQESGLGWMTTRGLEKFGVPELELRDIPPNLEKLSLLMNAMAQFLVEEASRQVGSDPKAATELTLPAEVVVDEALLGRAIGRPVDDQPKGGSAQAIGIRFDPKDKLTPVAMVQLIKPRQFSGDAGIWLNDVLGRLVGSESDVRMARTSGDAMTQAHERATSELPAVRRRFDAGLKPGEVLFFKHGFPTSTGDREYIWVVVNRWEGDKITAQVANDPNDVPGLLIGMTVMLGEADIFDWMIQLPDGRSVGGYTTQVVLAEGKQPG
jgi:uncharacterized protein YegJ (DUF2314 family)